MELVLARFRFKGLAVVERERREPGYRQTQRVELY